MGRKVKMKTSREMVSQQAREVLKQAREAREDVALTLIMALCAPLGWYQTDSGWFSDILRSKIVLQGATKGKKKKKEVY